MKTQLLFAASALALVAAFPVIAADVTVENDTNVTAEQQMKDGIEDARMAVKQGYHDIKASLLNEDPRKVEVTEVAIDSRNTASGIIGQPVLNSKNERVGKIHDIILDQNGNAQSVIVADGNILGMGKLASFDYGTVVKMNKDGDVISPLTEETIDKAAEFTYDREKAGPETKIIPSGSYSVAELLDADLLDSQKEEIADIDDVVIKNGQATQLIVGFDKKLGLGGEKTALSYKTASIVTDGDDQDDFNFQLNGANATQFENYKKSLKQ